MNRTLLKSVLRTNTELAKSMSLDALAQDIEIAGAKVKLFRDYIDGHHRANMTDEMRKMLRITADTGTDQNSSLNEFNDNLCEKIVYTRADRIEVTNIQAVSIDENAEAETETANAWIKRTMESNDFGLLQSGVTDSAIGDGDAYILVDWDKKREMARLTEEPAYDGRSGMIVIYKSRNDRIPALAIKIWHVGVEDGDAISNTTRINVYYPDKIEKYQSKNNDTPKLIEKPQPWPEEIGVPVRHLPNDVRSHTNRGQSAIENAVPLQDALNRLLYSMVMTAELSGFPIMWTKGFKPPQAFMPGSIIRMDRDGAPLKPEDVIDIGQLPGNEPTPFINTANWLIAQMATITDTPLPQLLGGDNASGEALKQREIGLLGRVQRFKLRAETFWKQVFDLAAAVEAKWSTAPPEWDYLKISWRDAQIRNDTEWVKTAAGLIDIVGPREVMRQMVGVYGWDESQIKSILDEKAADDAEAFAASLGFTGDFTDSEALLALLGGGGTG